MRELIKQAFARRGYVPYREVPEFAHGVNSVIDELGVLCEAGRAAEVVELTEYALARLERALDHVDDSAGYLGDVRSRLEALHLDACRRARPEPVPLAQRLFKRAMTSHWEVFDSAVVGYADVLGDAGIARYRALAEKRWAEVPQLRPGDDWMRTAGDRFRITRAMEALAELSGSLAEQISVLERDLASGYSFVRIAEACRAHGDDDLGIAWAQRGIAAFPDRPDSRLREFLIEVYRRRGCPAEALEHSLATFNARPDVKSYRELATDARALGQWPERREAAVALLRAPETWPAGFGDRGHSELVRVLLWEGDTDAAWRAACDRGCVPSVWLQLADRRREQHPEDALLVYRRHVEDTIDGRDARAYAAAVKLIDGTIRALLAECGRPDDFAAYVAEVRTAHKAKRNLLKLLDGLATD